MSKRIWITSAAALIACVLLLLRKGTEVPKIASHETIDLRTNQPSQSEQPTSVQNQQAPNTPISAAVPPVVVAPTTTVGGSNTVDPRVLAEWQGPIEFYGKVVDDSSNAVAGAKINFHWVEIPDKSGNRATNAESDVNGLFSLHGQRGLSLGVSVSKEGYYASRKDNDTFNYGPLKGEPFPADPQNPVIFNLRKKGTPEPLVAMKRNYRIPRDGTPIAVDVATGEEATGETGNLVVRCWTSDQGKKSGEKYDWRCTVTIPGGGAVATDEEFPFLAPESGYKPTAEITMPADRPDWKSDVDLKFFYRLADGRYGRMTFSMIAGGQHFCMIDSVLNPLGSRNLEPSETSPSGSKPPTE